MTTLPAKRLHLDVASLPTDLRQSRYLRWTLILHSIRKILPLNPPKQQGRQSLPRRQLKLTGRDGSGSWPRVLVPDQSTYINPHVSPRHASNCNHTLPLLPRFLTRTVLCIWKLKRLPEGATMQPHPRTALRRRKLFIVCTLE
jgi:hypothetical protein